MSFVSPTPEAAVGYMGPMFERLKDQGFVINSFLDVGAAHGHFSGFVSTKYPHAKITAVECNERDAYFLAKHREWDVHYACLGAEGGEKTFFIDKNSEIGGGSSFYRENTRHFIDCIEETKEVITIDTLFPEETFDFIKIDTQGSELDILKGGADVVSRATWLLLELSFQPYNVGAPLIDEVLQYTRSIGWRMYDTVGPCDGGHIMPNQSLKLQVDVLLKHG